MADKAVDELFLNPYRKFVENRLVCHE